MKIVNIILGLGTAIILGSLIVLGIAAFYPAPVAPNYGAIVKPLAPPVATPCAANDTLCETQLNEYQAQQQAQQDEFTREQDAYDAAMQIYNRNLFIIGNVVGMVVFAIGFWLLFTTAIAAQGVPIGIMLAGLWGIIYGYARGWGSTNDQLKFFIGLVIAVLVIGGSIWLAGRYQKKRAAI
jgi:hypothetical protein